jgi:hypothetical protein
MADSATPRFSRPSEIVVSSWPAVEEMPSSVFPTPIRPIRLTDALDLKILELIQSYVNRWEIEVNHRDEKQHLGIGDPQVWNDASVDRLPAFLVASYSFLLLASLEAYGAKRTDAYLRPPNGNADDPAPPA